MSYEIKIDDNHRVRFRDEQAYLSSRLEYLNQYGENSNLSFSFFIEQIYRHLHPDRIENIEHIEPVVSNNDNLYIGTAIPSIYQNNLDCITAQSPSQYTYTYTTTPNNWENFHHSWTEYCIGSPVNVNPNETVVVNVDMSNGPDYTVVTGWSGVIKEEEEKKQKKKHLDKNRFELMDLED